MKTGKEIKRNIFNDYSVIFGSVNNKNAKSVYINISSWAEPKNDEDINYSRVIKNINKKVKQTLFNYFDDNFENNFIKERTIVDLDIRESGIRYGKRSFMSCEITLYSTNEIPINTEIMDNKLKDLSHLIVDKVFNKDVNFKFNKKKK